MKAHPKLIEACTDLATAYYLRGQQLHNEIDSASAYTLLNTVLDQKPNDLIALFNRALIEQDLQSYTDAQEDWKRYLQLDPASPWADVARAQLSSIENTTGGQHGVLRRFQAPHGSATDSAIDGRVESYLDAALSSWLPQAFPPTGQPTTPESTATRETLHVLAHRLAGSHRDRWLLDFLTSGAKDAQFSEAVLWMAQSHNANAMGDYLRATQSATKASAHFSRAGNRAGWLMSRWEVLYATRLSYRAEECYGLSRGLWASLQATSYYWLQARASFDSRPVCRAQRKIATSCSSHRHKLTDPRRSHCPRPLPARCEGCWGSYAPHRGAW